jgi:hypothetical protein
MIAPRFSTTETDGVRYKGQAPSSFVPKNKTIFG